MNDKKLPPPPEFSIVIPMLNVEKYIETCIRSILSQTFQDFEIIIVDDCSTDRSVEIVESFDDPRITLLRNMKSSAAGVSRNLGLEIARGEFVYFMDSDDAITENALEIFHKATQEFDDDVIILNAHYSPEDEDFTCGERLKIQVQKRNVAAGVVSTDVMQRFFNMQVGVYAWNRIQRKKFLIENQIYFPETLRQEDLMFHVAEIFFARSIRIIDACCYIYRSHPNNTMRADPETQLRKILKSMPEIFRYLEDIFQRSNSNLSRREQLILEGRLMFLCFGSFVNQSYRGDIPAEKTDSIVREILSDFENIDANVVRILIHMLANCMINNDNLLKIIESRR